MCTLLLVDLFNLAALTPVVGIMYSAAVDRNEAADAL